MPGQDNNNLNFIRLYRRKQRLTQKEVAELLGYRSSSTISNYERGIKTPQLENLLKLEIICRTPVAFLFRYQYRELKQKIRRKEEERKPENQG